MMSGLGRYKFIIFTAIIILAFASVSVAIDPPHIPDLNVTCASCHNPSVTFTYATIDNTPWNEICWQCHDAGKSSKYSDTHSAISTGDDTAKKYWGGKWTNECRRCHDPHTNEQARAYPSAYPAGAWLYTGTIQASTYNTITASGVTWDDDEWIGKTLHPKTGLSFLYMIVDNTQDTLVVAGNMYPFIRMAGGTFAISYGKLIRRDFNAGRGIINSGGVVFDTSPFRTVKFLNSSGPSSGAIGGKDTDVATDAICVVCHTQTAHMNIGVAKYGGSFDTKPQYDHYYSDDEPCWNSSCHSPAPKGFAAGCTNCHGYAPVSDATLLNSVAPRGLTYRGLDYANGAGKHYVHFTEQGLGCAYCHNGGGTSGQHNDEVNPTVQIGFDIFGAQGGVYQAPGFTNTVYTLAAGGATSYVESGSDRVCSNIYCHSTVQAGDGVGAPTYKTADWDGAAFADCNPCHQASPTTASHDEHLASFTCNDCHSGNTHINGNIDVTTGSYTAGGTPQNGFGTCSTAPCHDDGTGTPAVTPTWGQAGGCDSCHASEPATGSHTGHLGYTSDISCSNCHDGADITTETLPEQHSDNNIDVYDATPGDLEYPQDVAKHASGSGYSTCSNINCHGSRSRTWGDAAAGDTCVKCHGDSTKGTPTEAEMAPPNDTNDDTTAEDEEVGAHQAHLTAASGISNTVGCTDCHAKPDNVFDSGHIDDTLPAELTWSSFVTNADTLTPSYDYGTGECANVYCHGANMPEGSNSGADTTPIWNDVAYISGIPSLSGYCAQCHGAPPTDSSGGSHSGSEAIDDCAVCHEHLNTDGSFSNALLHINGIVEGVSCSGCHGFPPVSNVTLINTPEDSNRDAQFTDGSGAHNTHYNVRGFDDCYICHYGGGPPGSHYTGQLVTMGFDVFGTKGGFYQAPTYTSSGFTLESGDVVNTTVNVVAGARVCSNIYCHSSAQGIADPTAAPTYATPDWDATLAGVSKCDDCHLAGSHTNNTFPDLQSGSHPEHLVYKFNASGTCQACHYDADADGCAFCHERDVASHVNNSIDVVFHPNYPRDNYSGGSYSGDTTPGTAYGSCSNLYCHSQGTKSSPTPYDPPNTTSYSWGGSLTADCTGCHNGDTGASSTMDTGSHGKHITDDDCSKCHKYTVDEGTSRIINTGSYQDQQTYGHRFHVDGFITIVFNGASSGGTYNGTSSPIQTRNPGTAYATCTNISCHGDGTGNLVETPTWGDSAGCGACHESEPATGSHSGHLGYTSDISCGDCHDGADITAETLPEQHSDNNIDVYNATPGDLNYPEDVAIHASGSGYSTCSNINCHGSTSRTWGDAAAGGTCVKCHGDSTKATPTDAEIAPPNDTNGDTSAADPEVGAHQAHLTAASGISNVNGIDCDNCHVKPTNVFDTGHIDNSLPAEITFGSLATLGSGTPNYSGAPGGTCSNVYCHDGRTFGKSTAAEIDFETPDWNETDLNDADGPGMCDNCHGYPPNAPHYGSDCSLCHDHVDPGDLSFTGVANRALHIDGAIRATGGCNGCHGYPPYPTDGNDYQDDPVQEGKGAHLVHVGSLMNEPGYTYGALDPDNDLIDGAKVAYVCGSCHDMTNHAMGTRAINFGGSTKYRFGSSGPTYNGVPDTPGSSNFKSCSNVSCHFYESPGWQDPTAPK